MAPTLVKRLALNHQLVPPTVKSVNLAVHMAFYSLPTGMEDCQLCSVEGYKKLYFIVKAIEPGATSGSCVVLANIRVDVCRHQVSVVACGQIILVI
jgi:hypothetical protein